MWWKRKHSFMISVEDVGQGGRGFSFSATKGQTIVEAATEAGVDFPHRCLVGGCGRCKCQRVGGRVRERTESAYVLSAEEIQAGFVLGCQSEVLADLELRLHPYVKPKKRMEKIG